MRKMTAGEARTAPGCRSGRAAQLRELHQVAHALQVRREAFLRQEPAHVRADEAVLHGRVHVRFLVRVRVMMAMMRSPPHGAALHGRGAEHAEDELPDTRGLERAVREVAVVERGDGEHAQAVQHDGGDHRDRTPAHPDDGEADGMHEDERQDARPVDLLIGLLVAGGISDGSSEGAGVEPAQDRANEPEETARPRP